MLIYRLAIGMSRSPIRAEGSVDTHTLPAVWIRIQRLLKLGAVETKMLYPAIGAHACSRAVL
jgi:hypothetical protein